MTPAAYLTVLILLGATAAFITGRWRPDAIAVLVLLALLLLGLVDVQTGLAGFGNPALFTVAAVFVVSAALEHVGIAAELGRRIYRLAGGTATGLVLTFGLAGGVLSGIINSLGAIAVLLPAAMAASREARLSPSKLLLPLALGTRLGGVLTLIAGPSNLIASEALVAARNRPLGLFEPVPVGVAFLLAGVAFMAYLGRELLPSRAAPMPPRADPLLTLYRLSERLFQLRLGTDSPLVGKSIAESELGKSLGVTVVGISRGRYRIHGPARDEVLLEGDTLIVQGNQDDVLRSPTLETMGLRLVRDPAPFQVESTAVRVVEAILAPRSTLQGKTLREIGFREKYGMSVLAIWREGRPRRTALGDVRIQHGDALLIQGDRERIRVLRREPDFLVLDLVGEPHLRTAKVPWAIGAIAVIVIASTTGLLSLAVASLLAASVVVLTGCLNVEEVYQAIDWRSLVFIGAMLPLGTALTTSGAAGTFVGWMLATVGHAPYLTLVAVLLVATVLNQLMPSVAATVLLAPIALHVAASLGASPYPFMMAVIAGTGTTFTPVGSPVNLLVMGPGGYRMSDYIRIGVPLAVLLVVLGAILIPQAWPLAP